MKVPDRRQTPFPNRARISKHASQPLEPIKILVGPRVLKVGENTIEQRLQLCVHLVLVYQLHSHLQDSRSPPGLCLGPDKGATVCPQSANRVAEY